MKISKIYISAFGGLKDFTLDLDNGLNVVYGNNEDGKSTVAAFIKAMFYGTGRNSKNLSESIRLKYTPWDNSVMAGRIYFEHKNKPYCLEKEFRKSDSTDRIVLTDLDSGKPIDVGENIGQQFFGLSAAAFERSLFIGNGDFIKDDAAAGEINGKLSNIALTGNEDVSLKAIQKNIFDTRTKLISKSGRSGSYNEDLVLLDALNQRLLKADEDAKSKAQLTDVANKKRQEYETLYKNYGQLKSILECEQDIKNREKLLEFLQTKQELDSLNQTLTLSDGTIINEAFTQKIDFAISKHRSAAERCEQINKDFCELREALDLQNEISLEEAQSQINSLTNDISTLNQKTEQCSFKENELNSMLNSAKLQLETAQNKKAKVNPILLPLSIVLAAGGGAVAYFASPIAAVILIAIAVILLVLSFIIKPQNTSAIATAQKEIAALNCSLTEIKTEKISIGEQINSINARINKLSAVVNADTALKQQLTQKEEMLNAEQLKLKNSESELFSLLSGFDNVNNIDSAKEFLQQLKLKTEKQKELKLKLKTASQFLGNIDYDEAQARLDALKNSEGFDNTDFDALKCDFEVVSEKISVLKDELTTIATELKASFKHSENPEDLKREILSLNESIQNKKDFCDAADLAISVLEESFYELRRGYGSELETATHNIFSKLTNGRYKSVSITDTLDLSVEKADVFGTRELDYLSLGTTHQAYLSLRLAIASLISDGAPLPIFLDDSLSQYDDTRAQYAMQFLKDYCKDSQGVLFTCHNTICDISTALDIPIIKPYK